MNRENDDIVISVDGSRKYTLMQSGAEYYKTKRYQEALDIFEEVILIDFNEAIVYVGKGDCLRQLGHHGQAIHTYEQAFAIDPNNVSAHVGSSYALVELGEYHRASLAYQKPIQLDPDNASAYNNAGQILCSQASFEEAIRLATAINNVAGFYNNKGMALCELKRNQEALDAFVQAQQLKAGNGKYLDQILLIPRYGAFKKANRYYGNADVLSS